MLPLLTFRSVAIPNDNLRRLRDEFLRQIDKRSQTGLLPCVVDAPPSTWDFTVPVKIGTQLVVASYQGAPPEVGDKGWVQRRGAGYDFITQVPQTALPTSGGGLTLPTLVPNTYYIHALNIWGHSYLAPLNPSPTFTPHNIANKLFNALGISWPAARNYGQGGSTLTQGWRYIFTNARPPELNRTDVSFQNRFGAQCFLFGFNDIAHNGDPTFEGSRFLNDWSNSWRAVFSWFRAAVIYGSDYIYGAFHPVSQGSTLSIDDPILWDEGKAGVTYTGTWTTPASTAGITASEARTTVAGSRFDLRLPPVYPGTPVTIYLGGEVGTTGATVVTVSNPGGTMAPITLSTNDRVRAQLIYSFPLDNLPSVVPVRITGLPKGDGVTSQTIRVTATTLAAGGRLTFFGWSIEAMHPPLLVPANIPPVKSFASPIVNTGGIPGNTDGHILHWPSYPQSNGVQSVAGGPAFNGGIRSGTHEADLWCRNYYNPALATVAAEFAPVGSVSVADLASVIDGSVLPELYTLNDLWGGDPVHPNPQGKAVIANAFLTAMNRIPLDPRHLIAPMHPEDAINATRFTAAHA